MKKMQYMLMGLCMLLYSCPWDADTKQNLSEGPIEVPNRTFGPYTMMRNILTVQGNITNGTMKIISEPTRKGSVVSITEQKFIYDSTSGFNVRSIYGSGMYKDDDMYVEKIEGRYFAPNNDYLKLLQKYKLTPSADFQGTMHIFLNFTSLYRCGLPDGSCDVRRVLAYRSKLATALKDNKPTSITYIGKNKTYPVGAGEPVVIDHTAEPESVRALMKAAQATGDPRLLVIKREAGEKQVTITAFGEEKKIDASETYEWKFGEAQLNELRQFVVKR